MRKILIANPFGLGDALFSMVLVEAVRKAYPDSEIGFVCNERTHALVQMNSSINTAFIFNRDLLRRLLKKNLFLFLKKMGELLGGIRKEKFDTFIDLSLGREYSFFAMLVGIPRRVGFDYKGRGIFLTQKRQLQGYSGRHAADIQLDLLEVLGIKRSDGPQKLPLVVPPHAQRDAHTFLRQHGIVEGDRIIALAPGGGRSWGDKAIFKQWDPERFARAVNIFCEGEKFKVVLLGDQSERNLLMRTAALLRTPVAAIAGGSIETVCALLARSELLLCNDGGLLHLANALGVKTVSIFGPVDEKVYGPYWNGVEREVITENVSCRPCYQNFRFPPCPHERRCLDHLPVEKVVAALHKIAYI